MSFLTNQLTLLNLCTVYWYVIIMCVTTTIFRISAQPVRDRKIKCAVRHKCIKIESKKSIDMTLPHRLLANTKLRIKTILSDCSILLTREGVALLLWWRLQKQNAQVFLNTRNYDAVSGLLWLTQNQRFSFIYSCVAKHINKALFDFIW